MQIFAYGTLMRGERNNRDLEIISGAFLGQHTTPPNYRMYNTGSFPMVVPDGHVAITGEVWQVDDKGLEYLDAREKLYDDTGEPTHMKRIEIDTPYGKAWMYVRPTPPEGEGVGLMLQGDWRQR